MDTVSPAATLTVLTVSLHAYVVPEMLHDILVSALFLRNVVVTSYVFDVILL